MPETFLSRRTWFGASGALMILLAFFFLLPSAFRGARLSIAGKKNNIKDWLPSDFRETVELDWFAKYFVGESFVVATWDGCTANDQRLSLLATKLRAESAERTFDPATSPEEIERARELAEKLQLFVEPASTTNWGGKNEKWLASPSGRSYFITPDGRLYRWVEESNVVAGVARALRRRMGTFELKGQFLVALGKQSSTDKANPFYNDPTLLAASLFQNVQTGQDLVNELSRPGGPLWPIDLTDASQREAVARTRAVERLTGTLFAPAVPEQFAWTPATVYDELPAEVQKSLPEDFDYKVRTAVKQIEARRGAPLDSSTLLSSDERSDLWAEVCAAIGIDVPPRQTCVLVTLTPFGKDHLARAIGRGVLGGPRGRLMILADQSGIAAAPPPSMAPPPFDHPENLMTDPSGRSMLRMGGPPVDNVAIDEEGTITLVRLVGYSGLVGIVLSFLCFRSVKLTIMIFMVGVSSAVLGLAITYWTGGHVDAILMSMPSLVYVAGLSSAIHIVNYYRDEVANRGTAGAADRAANHAFIPCMLSALTTAIGLLSLCSSNLVPIRNFGLYAGIAIMTTLLVLFTYLPAALEVFPPNLAAMLARRERKAIAEKKSPRGADGWATFGGWIAKHHVVVTIACFVLFVACFTGLFRIKTTVQLLKLFDGKSRILSDYAYLEENFGKLVPMELVVRMPPSIQFGHVADPAATDEPVGAIPDQVAATTPPHSNHPLNLLERVEAVARIDTVVRRSLGESGTGVIGKTMSAVTFLPPLPGPSNSYSIPRAKFQNDLNESLAGLEQTDCFRLEKDGPREGSELWRISLRVGALGDVDYGRFVGDLRLAVDPVMDAYRAREAILDKVDLARQSLAKNKSPQLLFLGRSEPKNLLTADLLVSSLAETASQSDLSAEQLIDANAIYTSSIFELMLGERITRPNWLDVDDENAKVRPGDERWERLMAFVDCVILVDDQAAVDVATLTKQAKHFVDVRPANLPVAEPMLDGRVPIEANSGPMEMIYTGIVPVVYKAQRTLLSSLGQSIAMAFGLIAVVMAVLLTPGKLPRAILQPKLAFVGLVAGLIAMVPNLFPVVVVFGFMGHAGLLVDIGTMMTASVAIGVAVDDTIHFLTWFRQHLDSGMSRLDAVVETYRRVGPAMMQTTIVGGLGLFVFSLSTFTPTQRFGTLMLVLLATALVGDLILLPALLAGPLGRWFRPRVIAPAPSESPPHELASGKVDAAMAIASPANRNGDAIAAHRKQPGPPAPKSASKLSKQDRSDAKEW